MNSRTRARASLFAFVFLVAPLAAGPASAETKLTKLWEATGFSTPESALVAADVGTIFVSNVAGSPMDKDGNGFISRLKPDGTIEELKWVTGLNAPKGLAIAGGKLYVADIDQLVAIDIAKGEIVKRYDAAGAKFMNDVAADASGNVYASDMMTDVIWRLSGDTFEKWIESPELFNPNGLLVDGDRLLVAAWGTMTDGFATKVPGHMLQIALADKTIKPMGSTDPVGNLDGLEAVGKGEFLVTDWMAGKLFHVDGNGSAVLIVGDLGQGSADIGFDSKTRTLYLPMMSNDKIVAYKVE